MSNIITKEAGTSIPLFSLLGAGAGTLYDVMRPTKDVIKFPSDESEQAINDSNSRSISLSRTAKGGLVGGGIGVLADALAHSLSKQATETMTYIHGNGLVKLAEGGWWDQFNAGAKSLWDDSAKWLGSEDNRNAIVGGLAGAGIGALGTGMMGGNALYGGLAGGAAGAGIGYMGGRQIGDWMRKWQQPATDTTDKADTVAQHRRPITLSDSQRIA